MSPGGIDSLDAESLKGLVLSLLARIDELAGQNTALLARIDELLARIAELEGRSGKPPKTPRNSSLPPSRGQKDTRLRPPLAASTPISYLCSTQFVLLRQP